MKSIQYKSRLCLRIHSIAAGGHQAVQTDSQQDSRPSRELHDQWCGGHNRSVSLARSESLNFLAKIRPSYHSCILSCTPPITLLTLVSLALKPVWLSMAWIKVLKFAMMEIEHSFVQSPWISPPKDVDILSSLSYPYWTKEVLQEAICHGCNRMFCQISQRIEFFKEVGLALLCLLLIIMNCHCKG